MSPIDRLGSLPRRIESRVANPVVAALLRSPAHPLLSRWLLLLSYEGRRSGRRYTTPVLYRPRNGDVVLFTPAEHTNWWRNFRGGHPLRVLLRGHWRTGHGDVVADEDAVLAHLRDLTGPVRRASHALVGRPVPGDGTLRERAGEFVLVRVTLNPETAVCRSSDVP